jgi:3-phytase
MSHRASKPALVFALFSSVAASGIGACSSSAAKASPAGSAASSAAPATLAIAVVPETFITPFDSTHNVDSPAFYTTPSGDMWILSTAKTPNFILVNDANTGKDLRTVATTGTGLGHIRRPNGIAVIDSLMLVVERDNHRVQGFLLPSFKPVGIFGDTLLKKPYGVAVYPMADGTYSAYITDNYETADGETPPDAELGARVKQFSLSLKGGKLAATHVRSFGDTTGPGVLRVVESIIADPVNNRLAIAEELPTDSYIKMYDLNGRFTGKIMGRGSFPQQAEGIALYSCPDGSGYWIGTDQGNDTNTYTIFDRKTLEPVGRFTGAKARRTDGVALTQKAFGPFPAGAFVGSHLDGSIAAFSWATIADSLKLRKDCTT